MRRLAYAGLIVCILFSLIFVTVANAAPTRADRGEWAPNVWYNVGDTVTYNGSTYTCLQAHTSQIGWEPPNVPALWQLGGSSGPTNTPTRTPTATATRTATISATPTQPSGSIVYPAEAASFGGGVTIDSNNGGFLGTGYANFPLSGGFLQFNSVSGGIGGNASLRIRYALGATTSRTGLLIVNGAGQNITFSPTGAWTTWSLRDVTVPLNGGTTNTIRFESNGQDLANLDQIEIILSGAPTNTPTPTRTPTLTATPTCACFTNTPTRTPTVTATSSVGAPAKPSISIQKVWDVGGGNYFDVIWSKWTGNDATSWDLIEDGQVIYTASIAPNNGAQTATYRVTNKTYGVYTYKVTLRNSAGSTTSDPASYAVGGASNIKASPVDGARQALQATLSQGTNSLALSIANGSSATYSVVSNNPSVVTASISGSTLTVNGLKAGRASLRINASTGDVRYLGIRVKNADGSNPGMPAYVSVGSVSEDTDADLAFWRSGYTTGLTAKRADIRYIYINGGPFNGWRSWVQPDGWRVTSYVRESLKLGLIPFFVYYNIPDGGESYSTDKQHIEDSTYMTAYFKDLKFFLDMAKAEAGDEMVGVVLEPDFIGYMMQNSNGRNPIPADQLLAKTSAAYSSGVLTASDPQFPDNIKGLVQAINYIIKKNLPNAYFGWQFNLWASPGITISIPSTGIIRLTDSMGISAGRSAIASEAQVIANYYINAGVTLQGASFVSIDKYGLDAGISSPSNPLASTWFWNADHWNNYLLFAKTIGTTTGKPVILWQIPVGHINSSQLANPYAGGLFPDLNNTSQHYEDSSPDFFLGDSFKPGSGRFSYFATNLGGDGKISASGDTVTWGNHMAEAKASGITSILFGAGVGDSTDGIGNPPTDSYWWITAVQKYYQSGVIPLP